MTQTHQLSLRSRPSKLYMAVVDGILDLIASGRLKPGDKLPTEPEISEQMGVGRSSVREAMKSLEAIGFVTVYQGRGTFVSSNLPDVLKKQMCLATRFRRWSLSALLEARRPLEIEATRLAVMRATDSDIEAAEEVLVKIAGVHDPVEFVRLGMDFHLKIAQASHSDVIVDLLEGLRLATQEAFSLVPRSRHQLEESSVAHLGILNAIKARDAELAVSIVQRHMDSLTNYAAVPQFSRTVS